MKNISSQSYKCGRSLLHVDGHLSAVANGIWSFFWWIIFIVSLITYVGCQSPIETPPEIVRNITVRVVDSSNVPLPFIPVEVHRGETRSVQPLALNVTDQNGNAPFQLKIPQNGAAFTFIAGTAQTGKIQTTANLLCRDTTLVFVFGRITIPCGATIVDTIRFKDVCARTASGVEFPTTIQRLYCSTCDVPLTITLPLTLPQENAQDELQLSVFDQNGSPVSGNNFVLGARACFSVRVTYTPKQPGIIQRDYPFVGTGANNSQMNITVSVAGNAIECNRCVCGDSLTIIDLGNVVVSPPDSSSVISRTVNTNKSQCTREDNLIKNFLASSVFKLENSILSVVRPNESQPVQIRFTPIGQGAFQDTLIYQTRYRETGLVCRHTVIVRANGVQPLCCLDLAGTSAGYVVASGSPRVDTLHLKTRMYERTSGDICFRNCGTGGWLTVSQQLAFPVVPGFRSSPDWLNLDVNSSPGCFTVSFNADTSIVRPEGLGGPAKVRHETDMNILGCTPQRVHIVVDVDTLPLLFSNCVYRWSQNSMNGYNFTPPENKGSFIVDVNGNNTNMTTDFTLMSIGGASADVRVRSGWVLIRTGVVDQNDFSYANVKQYPNFNAIKQGPFNSQQNFTMNLFSVYSIRIQRGSQTLYALVRVREISTDGQKDKICFDVLFPM